MIRKLKNLSSTHHHFRLPNGGQETVSFFAHNCTVYDCTCCTFKLFRYISQDPTDCYIFIQSLFTEICENSQSKRDHQIFKEWRRLWTELYLFQVWVSFLRLQHSIFSKIAHYFANSLDSQGSNSEWWLTKTQPVFRISTRRPSELLNLRSSRTKNSLLKNNLSRMRNLLRIWIWFLWRDDVWHKAKSFTPCHHEVAVVGWEHCLFHQVCSHWRFQFFCS